jgi:hypothetical protein
VGRINLGGALVDDTHSVLIRECSATFIAKQAIIPDKERSISKAARTPSSFARLEILSELAMARSGS